VTTSHTTIIIYAPKISVRLQYVLEFMFSDVLHVPYKLVREEQDLQQGFFHVRYEYGQAKNVCSSNLLFEENVQAQAVKKSALPELPIIFANDSAFGFDIFAAVFYVLSRYEEYLPHTLDEYGRYDYRQSIVNDLCGLRHAIVNRWIWYFYACLQKQFDLPNTNAQSSVLHTYDVDMAFAIHARSKAFVLGSIAKSTAQLRFAHAARKLSVWQGQAVDYFDCFDAISKAHAKQKAIFFMLMAEKNSEYNRNNLPNEEDYISLINELSLKFSVAIHPSYEASRLPHLIEEEKLLLQKIISKHVQQSRFHFIRYNLPNTYRHLLKYGVTEDYSCGYGSTNGFRAGTSTPHFWFDVQANEVTTLKLFPFVWMDANCFYEHKFSVQQAEEDYEHFYNEVKNTGGLFTPIWHNFIIGQDPSFNKYKLVWENCLSLS
jgi:hypothetical protein